jgi:hypothetical protein
MTTLDEALFSQLSDPAMARQAVDAINAVTRAKMREPSYFRLICPIIPAGAPWWEIGWPAKLVAQAYNRRLETARRFRERKTTKAEWKRLSGELRDDRYGRRSSRELWNDKLDASMVVLAGLVAQIRSVGS